MKTQKSYLHFFQAKPSASRSLTRTEPRDSDCPCLDMLGPPVASASRTGLHRNCANCVLAMPTPTFSQQGNGGTRRWAVCPGQTSHSRPRAHTRMWLFMLTNSNSNSDFCVMQMSSQIRTRKRASVSPCCLSAPDNPLQDLGELGPKPCRPRQTHTSSGHSPSPQPPRAPSPHVRELIRGIAAQRHGRGQLARHAGLPSTHSQQRHPTRSTDTQEGVRECPLSSTGMASTLSFIEDLLSVYCVPGAALGPGDAPVTQTDPSRSWDAHSTGGPDSKSPCTEKPH